MAIFRGEVVYVDPTNEGDVLSASPARNNESVYGCISVTHGAHFDEGAEVCNYGTTQSVCVKPGDEVAVLTKLGDQLRGVHESSDLTVVTTMTKIQELRSALLAEYPDTSAVLDKFIGELATSQLRELANRLTLETIDLSWAD